LSSPNSRFRHRRANLREYATLSLFASEAFIISVSPYRVLRVRDIQALRARYPTRCVTRT